MDQDWARKRLAADAVGQEWGLRKLEELTGVSFSTLSRFFRGADVSAASYKRIHAYLTGEPLQKVKPSVFRRFKVGSKTFVVEIREV